MFSVGLHSSEEGCQTLPGVFNALLMEFIPTFMHRRGEKGITKNHNPAVKMTAKKVPQPKARLYP
jgi:hypothetical protein